MWCNNKVYILAPLYVVANFCATFSLFSLYSALFTVLVLLLTYFIHLKAKKRMKYYHIGLYALFSQAGYLFLQIYLNGKLVAPILNVMLGLLFLAACVKLFEAIVIKGFAFKLTIDEIVCSGVILAIFASGICGLSVGSFEIIKFFAAFLILISSYCVASTASFFISAIFGFGALMALNNPIYVTAFVLWTLVVNCFKTSNKFFAGISLLAVEALLGWYFNIYSNFNVFSYLPVVIACVFYVCLPNKSLDEFKGFFAESTSKMASKNIVNQNRELISKKLGRLAEVFAEMDTSFRGMIKGGLTKQQSIEMLKEEIKDKICYDCPEKNKCHRALAEETNRVLTDIVSNCFERGKATLIDVPPYLSSRCNRLSPMISTINQLAQQYKQYDGLMKNFDASRVLIAEQLGGVAKIMRSLSSEINKNVKFDSVKEAKILDELAYQNIICCDAIVYAQNEDVIIAILLVKNEDKQSQKLVDITSKVCGSKMMIESIEDAQRSGWSLVSLKTAPMFDVVFGTSLAVKAGSEVSGDSYSLIKIDSDKFMMALCDGMGSGKKAEKASNLSMNIIENFYKAGFDNELILSSANKLLSLGNDEMFSALDLCIIDLRRCYLDSIKLGAPPALIKGKNGIKVVDGSALPLGILKETQPTIKKEILNDLDTIILATDGITDSFYSLEDYSNFV
ncbi:MAG: SpoIIE family protein phosphatase, partial [Clostridia bacterium]|nr:SpoIIE family protein phosphatase [Clostridia bacterium]